MILFKVKVTKASSERYKNRSNTKYHFYRTFLTKNQSKAKQSKAKQNKTKQSKAKQSKTKQNKAKQSKQQNGFTENEVS